MDSVDNVGVTFVNTVIGRGILNNVVNLQFGTLLFNPNTHAQGVEFDLAVSCRLRMDRQCAQLLYESLGELLSNVAQEEDALHPETEASAAH